MKFQNMALKQGILILGSMATFTLAQLCHPFALSAQTLDQEVGRLLDNNCSALSIGNNANQLGVNLQNVCGLNGPQTGAGSSSLGGGAASVQASAASILNRTMLQRLVRPMKKKAETIEGPPR